MTSAASDRRGWLVALALCAGCPPPPSNCPFWGTKGAPASIEIGMWLDGGFSELTQDGMPVDLTFPVQGGHVLFVGARIHDMPGCRQTIAAEVYVPGGSLYAFEERRVDFTVPDEDGGLPDLSDTSNVANVPMCPDYGTRDVVNQDWVLTVTVSDDAGYSATAQRHVTPVCRQTDPTALTLCQCE